MLLNRIKLKCFVNEFGHSFESFSSSIPNHSFDKLNKQLILNQNIQFTITINSMVSVPQPFAELQHICGYEVSSENPHLGCRLYKSFAFSLPSPLLMKLIYLKKINRFNSKMYHNLKESEVELLQ